MTDSKDDKKTSNVPTVDKTKENSASADKTKAPEPAKKETAKTTPVKTDPKAETKKPDPKAKPDPKKPAAAADKKASGTTTQPKADVKTPKKKGSWKLKAAGFLIIVAAGAGAGAYYTQDIWVPQVKKKTVDILGLETVMEPAAPAIDPAILDDIKSRLSAVETREIPSVEMPEPVDLTPLVEQINQLENNVSSIKISNGDAESLAKIEELVAKVEGLSTPDLSELTPDLSGLESENAALRELVDGLVARIDALEQEKLVQRSATDTAQALVAALSTLRQALMGSDSFSPQLAVLSTLAEGDAEMEGLVSKLQPHAENGIKSFSALLTTYDRMADDVVRAVAIPDGADWMEETVKNITTLVSIRRAPGEIDGEGPLGIIARAEHNISSGDLAQALEELSLLEGKSMEAASAWMTSANARLMAEETLAGLQARILARINGA